MKNKVKDIPADLKVVKLITAIERLDACWPEIGRLETRALKTLRTISLDVSL